MRKYIKHLTGNIFETRQTAIVNTVNCVSVMGAGLALAFKQKFPIYFHDYCIACKKRDLELGKPWIYHNTQNRDIWIISFPTKGHWKTPSNIQDIEDGLCYLRLLLMKDLDDWKFKFTGIAFPLLGCNNGGLNSKDVIPLIEKYMDDIGLEIEIWTPITRHQ